MQSWLCLGLRKASGGQVQVEVDRLVLVGVGCTGGGDQVAQGAGQVRGTVSWPVWLQHGDQGRGGWRSKPGRACEGPQLGTPNNSGRSLSGPRGGGRGQGPVEPSSLADLQRSWRWPELQRTSASPHAGEGHRAATAWRSGLKGRRGAPCCQAEPGHSGQVFCQRAEVRGGGEPI